MKTINFFYPLADIDCPKTGGQIYDSYLYNTIKKYHNPVLWDNTTLESVSRKTLIFRLLKVAKKITNNDCNIFNSSLYVYYLPLLLTLKLTGKKAKSYCIHHHFRYIEFKGIGRYIRFFLETLCLRLCNGVISPNPYTTDEIVRLLPKTKIVNLRMAFDKTEYIYNPTEGNLLFVGTVYPRKGLDFLIDAFCLMSEEEREGLRLTIAGNIQNHDFFNSLKQKIKKYQIENKVSFLGRVSDKQLNQLYSNASWFILPSLHEGYGMVMAEAMSYGIPVIAFNNSAIPYLIKDGENGLLVKDRDSQDLREKILITKNNRNLHLKLSEGAKETFRKLPSLDDLDFDIINFLNSINGNDSQ